VLARQLEQENAQVEAARKRFANGKATRLSQLGALDRHEFRLFLALLAEALSAQGRPDDPVERTTADGLLRVRLQPLLPHTRANLETELGRFSGRDHLITVAVVNEAGS
jgi:uncharacterized protein (TIGR02677 family)